MNKRLAGPDEVPKYGAVWVWDDGGPMMAVAEADLSRDRSIRRWLFVRLDNHRDTTAWMWVGRNTGDWWVLDD